MPIEKPLRGSSPVPDHILLSICGDAKTTIAVSWRTDCSVQNGWLEIQPEAGGEVIRFEAVSR